MNEKPIVDIKNVSISFGCHPVLENISLKVFHGDCVGITGPNGSGKTTLLKLILGQLKPQSGSISLFGHDYSRFKDFHKISYVSQRATSFNQSFPITVEETVATGRITGRNIFRFFNREDRSQIHRALEQVGMEEYKNHLLGSLSGGQQQRVFIARALAREPELLLLDEPTNGLDRNAQDQMYALMKEMADSNKYTLIIVSHDLISISPIITKQVCLNFNICTCSCHSGAWVQNPASCSRRLWPA